MDNIDKLVNAICLGILSVPNLDVSTIDFELAKVIRSRNEELTKPLLDKIKKAVMDRLRDPFDNNELGGIPGIAIKDYTSTVQAAKQGQDVDLVQLLCPKKLRSGEVVSFAAGHELPPGFDMSTCPTTNVLSHLLNRLRDKPTQQSRLAKSVGSVKKIAAVVINTVRSAHQKKGCHLPRYTVFLHCSSSSFVGDSTFIMLVVRRQRSRRILPPNLSRDILGTSRIVVTTFLLPHICCPALLHLRMVLLS